jgi:RND family efflux transporter MFP subunit
MSTAESRTKRAYILLTSLAWAIALAAVFAWFLRRPATHAPAGSPAPLAVGPAMSSSAAPTAPSGPVEAPLASVQFTSEQMQSIGVRTGTAMYKQLKDDLRATGTVAVDDRLVSYVQVRFSGYLRNVFADATYQFVRKGQPLFTIYSPDLVATEEEYLLARENRRRLGGSTIGNVAADADALSTAAEQRLRQWEVSASQIQAMKSSGKAPNDVAVESPATGYILERNALPNMYVEPATRLYTIADLSRVWVNAQVFQTDAGRLRPGSMAAVTVDAYPRRTFHGRVEQILPQVDMATRTVPVRLSIENAGVLLKPGMFVNVDLPSPLGRQLVVPAIAVFQTGMRQVVFLYHGNGRIDPEEVVLGPRVGDEYVVLKGLAAGQAIVTSANFLIDSESQLEAASGAPPPAASASRSTMRIDLTTDPNPPHKGTNVFRVKLTGNNGAPVAGADITVTFYMPAMAAMGMAAMKTTAKLTDKSGGFYEGAGTLGSGGTWQVTVTASEKGQVVASRQLRLNAEGGM